jgi:hypothetical protein
MPLHIWFITIFSIWSEAEMECGSSDEQCNYDMIPSYQQTNFAEGGGWCYYPPNMGWIPWCQMHPSPPPYEMLIASQPQPLYDMDWQQNWYYPYPILQMYPQLYCISNEMEYNPTPPLSLIPIQEADLNDKESYDDKCWYDYATIGYGTRETVQNAIDNGYDINKNICYEWHNKLIIRPAIEIAMYNPQYDYALLLAIMGASITYNTLYVAFTAGSFASCEYIYETKKRKSVFNYYDIITFYHQNYIAYVKRIVIHHRMEANIRQKMMEYMKISTRYDIDRHVTEHQKRRQYFFDYVVKSFENFIFHRLDRVKTRFTRNDVEIDDEDCEDKKQNDGNEMIDDVEHENDKK